VTRSLWSAVTGLWNCHIHTNDVGAAIEAALDAGRPREIRVSDLAEQVAEERWVREGGHDEVTPLMPVVPPVTSVVAVATGEGSSAFSGHSGSTTSSPVASR